MMGFLVVNAGRESGEKGLSISTKGLQTCEPAFLNVSETETAVLSVRGSRPKYDFLDQKAAIKMYI